MMNQLLDQELFEIISNMSSLIEGYTGVFISLSLGIASILLMIVIASESYKLMLGGKSFDPIWWIRPLLMLLIILTWQAGGNRRIQGSLPGIITSVFGRLENPAKQKFLSKMAVLQNSKKKKAELLSQKWDELLEKGAEIEAAKDAIEQTHKEEQSSGVPILGDVIDNLNQKFESIKTSIINYSKVILLQISSWVDTILEWVGNIIWAIAVYSTFMAQGISIAFLKIFGPMHFALSIFDTWRDAWASWLMRFISFQFYGFVAYIIMIASCSLIDYGIQCDIKILSQPGFPEAFSFNAVYTLFGYLIGALAMKMVPEIVSWIVPTNASQAAGQFSQGLSSSTLAPAQRVANEVSNKATRSIVSAGGTIARKTGGAAIGVASSVGSYIRNGMGSSFQSSGSKSPGGDSSPPKSSPPPPSSSGNDTSSQSQSEK